MICDDCLVKSVCVNPCKKFMIKDLNLSYLENKNMVKRLCRRYKRKWISYLNYTVLINDRLIIFSMAGKIHRDGGPAIIYSNGMKGWYRYGKFIKHEKGV